jgi:hypothetical protein
MVHTTSSTCLHVQHISSACEKHFRLAAQSLRCGHQHTPLHLAACTASSCGQAVGCPSNTSQDDGVLVAWSHSQALTHPRRASWGLFCGLPGAWPCRMATRHNYSENEGTIAELAPSARRPRHDGHDGCQPTRLINPAAAAELTKSPHSSVVPRPHHSMAHRRGTFGRSTHTRQVSGGRCRWRGARGTREGVGGTRGVRSGCHA